MAEYLTFNSGSQWELHKSAPSSDYKPGSERHKVFAGANINGDLPYDRGQKGTLHDTGSGHRPKNATNFRTAGKTHREMESVHNARNPGVGD